MLRPASPATTAHYDPYFLFTRSPESGDALQGQPLALVSDLPRDDWWSDEHSARDLYNELPPTGERHAPWLLNKAGNKSIISIMV